MIKIGNKTWETEAHYIPKDETWRFTCSESVTEIEEIFESKTGSLSTEDGTVSLYNIELVRVACDYSQNQTIVSFTGSTIPDDAKEAMSGDIDDLNAAVVELAELITELQDEIAKLKGGSNEGQDS